LLTNKKRTRSPLFAGAGNSVLLTNRGFKFQKRRQQLIAAHNEPLSVVAVSIDNPDCFAHRDSKLTPSPNSIRLC
jgi:hypothetical protein